LRPADDAPDALDELVAVGQGGLRLFGGLACDRQDRPFLWLHHSLVREIGAFAESGRE
jgi:hypothetical protein